MDDDGWREFIIFHCEAIVWRIGLFDFLVVFLLWCSQTCFRDGHFSFPDALHPYFSLPICTKCLSIGILCSHSFGLRRMYFVRAMDLARCFHPLFSWWLVGVPGIYTLSFFLQIWATWVEKTRNASLFTFFPPRNINAPVTHLFPHIFSMSLTQHYNRPSQKCWAPKAIRNWN